MKSCFLTNWCGSRARRREYSSFGGWRGEVEEVGKYAGAGGVFDWALDDIVECISWSGVKD